MTFGYKIIDKSELRLLLFFLLFLLLVLVVGWFLETGGVVGSRLLLECIFGLIHDILNC